VVDTGGGGRVGVETGTGGGGGGGRGGGGADPNSGGTERGLFVWMPPSTEGSNGCFFLHKNHFN